MDTEAHHAQDKFGGSQQVEMDLTPLIPELYEFSDGKPPPYAMGLLWPSLHTPSTSYRPTPRKRLTDEDRREMCRYHEESKAKHSVIGGKFSLRSFRCGFVDCLVYITPQPMHTNRHHSIIWCGTEVRPIPGSKLGLLDV
jgi:hypothetical protein